MYDFDKAVDRHNTGSVKVDLIKQNHLPEDTIPLWVADMDFETVPEVIEAVKKVAEHGIYGYTFATDSYYEAVQDWFLRRFGWKVEKEWMLTTSGVVYALSAAVRAFTQPGDGVMIQRPVYYPFSRVIEQNDRVLVNSPLVYESGTYRIDFADFEKKIEEHQVTLFLLCNPHNPVGRVWTREELVRIGEICRKHDVFVVSDEIHCDFVMDGREHINFASISKSFAQNCMVCTAPSKTFNLAGMQLSNLFIPNEEMRQRMKAELLRISYPGPNPFGLAACEAAYRHGAAWLDELLIYLQGNRDFVEQFVTDHMPKAKVIPLQGTYLLWLDVSAYGYTEEMLEERLREKARLWLDPGNMFGPEGKGFVRINLASPRKVIAQAMERFLLL